MAVASWAGAAEDVSSTPVLFDFDCFFHCCLFSLSHTHNPAARPELTPGWQTHQTKPRPKIITLVFRFWGKYKTLKAFIVTAMLQYFSGRLVKWERFKKDSVLVVNAIRGMVWPKVSFVCHLTFTALTVHLSYKWSGPIFKSKAILWPTRFHFKPGTVLSIYSLTILQILQEIF